MIQTCCLLFHTDCLLLFFFFFFFFFVVVFFFFFFFFFFSFCFFLFFFVFLFFFLFFFFLFFFFLLFVFVFFFNNLLIIRFKRKRVPKHRSIMLTMKIISDHQSQRQNRLMDTLTEISVVDYTRSSRKQLSNSNVSEEECRVQRNTEVGKE